MTVTGRYTTGEEVGVCAGDCSASGDLCVGVAFSLGLSLTYWGETRVSKKSRAAVGDSVERGPSGRRGVVCPM